MALSADNLSDVENTLRTIFRRCVECPKTSPSCPQCPENETCSLKAASCSECASTTCVQIGSLPGQAKEQSSTPVGAIAGGVVGGVAVICILTYLIYRCCIKRRRTQEWVEQPVEKRDQTTLSRNQRQSTRSAHSIASTVLTRASNVIQIAYIPGVTNRTPPDSPSNPIPPVPALPFSSATNSAATTPHLEQDMHFFMPSDLRDSTYSNMTAEQRMSIAPSLARSSVATTIYRNNAIVSPMPAQQAFRTRPAMVSVKSGAGTTGSGESSPPPVPQVPANMNSSGSSIVARNVTARPIEVRKGSSGNRVPTLGNLARAGQTSNRDSVRSTTSSSKFLNEKEVVVSKDASEQPLKPQQSYLSFGSTTHSSVGGRPNSTLQDVSSNRTTQDLDLNSRIENALMNAARDPTHMMGSRPELRTQDSGPFSDSHELKENMIP